MVANFFKSVHTANALVSALSPVALPPTTLDVKNTSSILGVTRQIASDIMSIYYRGTDTTFADLPSPYYWWECGELMGALLDYSHLTNDSTWDRAIATALLNNTGPDDDFMLPKHFGDEGNDDLAYWGFAVLAAAERNFPQPDPSRPSWLQISENVWNSLASRWDNTTCGGGLRWQIFASNPNGLTYKNTVANGGFFQLSARLARATGNTTYSDWATKIWEWSLQVGFIDEDWNVLDGGGIDNDCKPGSKLSFSYTTGIYMYGTAVMSNLTGISAWADHTKSLLAASASFLNPFPNATNIIYEHACEQVYSCTPDMLSFKGSFSRFVYASTLMVPQISNDVAALWEFNAGRAAQTCNGGANHTECGTRWYIDGYDGFTGLGQEMSALETIQGLLTPSSTAPFRGDEIKVVREFRTPSPSPVPTTTSTPPSEPTAAPTKRSISAGRAHVVDMRWVALSALLGIFTWLLA